MLVACCVHNSGALGVCWSCAGCGSAAPWFVPLRTAAYSGICRSASAAPWCFLTAFHRALALRISAPAAHGLWSCQSCNRYPPAPSASRNRTSSSTETNAPSSPSQSAASSISSSVMPERSPSRRLAAAHKNRHTRFQAAAWPSRLISFLVFGCVGKPTAMRASVVITQTTLPDAQAQKPGECSSWSHCKAGYPPGAADGQRPPGQTPGR